MSEDERDEKETERRRDEALRRALNTPPTPHEKDKGEGKPKRPKKR